MKKIQLVLIALILACGNSFGFANSHTQNYNKAVSYLNDNDFNNNDMAINLLSATANNGHALSARYLGMLSWFGKCNDVDQALAQDWLYYADMLDTYYRLGCDINTAAAKTTSQTFTCYYVTIYSVNKGSAGYQDCVNRIKTLRSQFPQFDFHNHTELPYHEINVGYFLTKSEAEAVAKSIANTNKDYSRTFVHSKSVKYRN